MHDRWLALALIFITRVSMGVQFQSIASVGPLVVDDLRLSYAQLGTLVGLYLLPGVALALPGGLLGRRFGERRTVIGSLAVMALGGLLTAWSETFVVAAIGRLVSGGAAVLMNMAIIKLTADWFAEREMATAMAVMLTAWPVGVGTAVTTLGAVATATSWRTAIVVASMTAVLGIAVMALLFRNPPIRVAPGASARLRASDTGLAVTSGLAWGTFNAAVIVVVAFAPPMLVARGMSLGQAGLLAGLAVWVSILSVPIGGLLSDRIGRANLQIIAGCAVATALLIALPSMAAAWLGLFLLGVVAGAVPGPLTSLLPRALTADRLAVGLGLSYTVFYAVMALTQPAAGLTRDVTGDPAAPIRFASAAMALTILALAGFRLIERRRPA
jgi:predicted MFS family arabinose efflux permease